jgi:hypothetical protein
MPSPKTIVILQSNYIPWKGYFDLMACADEFLLFDEAQFTRRDWRNRNRIIINGESRWLTIPVAAKGKFDAPIREIEISERDWAEKHWRSIALAYGKAPHFARYAPALEAAYAEAGGLRRLSDVNRLFLGLIAEFLGVPTPLLDAFDAPRRADSPTGRLVEICLARGAARYVSGPAARAYIDEAAFREAGVELRYADYSGYPQYDQASGAFEHGVSAVDLLMRCGSDARTHLKSVRARDGLLAPE